MSSQLRRSTALAASLFLVTALTPPAFAQGVTAVELWGTWQDGVAVAGGTLSATEAREGNQLVLNDVRLDLGDETGVLQLEKLTLINQADGSVGVILPDSFPLMFELPEPPAGAPVAADRPEKVFVTVDAPDLNLTVRGLGEKAEFQAAAPDVTLTLDRFLPPLPPEEGVVTARAVLNKFDLRYLQDLAVDAPMVDGALSFDSLNALLSVSGGVSGDNARMEMTLGKSSAALSGAMPVKSPALEAVISADSNGQMPLAGVLALFDAGMRGSASVSLGPSDFTGSVKVPGPEGEAKPTDWSFGFADLSLSLGADATKAGYATALKELRFLVKGDIPDFPADEMEFSVGEYRVSLEAGLNGLTSPQDWKAAWVLRDFAMSDAMWGHIVPTANLPRDPLTLALDLGGRYAISPEALKPGFMPSETELPFTVFGFKINEMTLYGLGVHVAGQGGLDFDFTDITTFEGMPLPSGRVSVLTTGVYGLIDLLSKSGDMSVDDLRVARAALLSVGRAGEAPDTLHTDIDFRDKSFYLNGIKIR